MSQYSHQQENFGQYRNFEDQQQKDYGLRQGGFTMDDRITGLDELTHEPTPPPVVPKPKPKKVNPNLFGFHPKLLAQTEDEFDEQQNIALLKENDNEKNSVLSSANSSINRVEDNWNNTKHHPKHFKDRGSLQSFAQIDEIPLKHKIGGLISIIIAIACWVSLGHILKNIQSDYDKPYFVSYCITVGLFVAFIPWICMYCYDKYNKRQQFTESAFKNDTTFVKQEILYKESIGICKKIIKLILPSIIFSILIVCCGYFWILSLNKTMVSVNTTIYQSNVAIIYVLSIFLLGNRLSWQKNIGVVLCGSGVLIVLFGAYKDEDQKENDDIKNEAAGIIECIVSVICYSLNAILFKITANKYFNENKQIKDTLLLQWMTGLIGLLILWPVMVVFHSISTEEFELPETSDDMVSLVVSIILNLLFFVSFEIAIILTNPVIASMGCLFVVPVGYFSDIIIHAYEIEMTAIVGTIAIGFGFMLLNVPIFAYIKSKIK